jgi:hypothetical protein
MVARAWTDDQFRQKLLQQPGEAFAEYELDVPAGQQLRVVEDTPQVSHFVLPSRPTDLSALALERIPGAIAGPAAAEDPSSDDCHCGGCHDCGHCHCGGCGDCGHCGSCGGCGDCGDCGHCHCD